MGAVRIRHSKREIATQPVILWILLGGKPKWLPLNFGFNDVMRTTPIMSIHTLSFAFGQYMETLRAYRVKLCVKHGNTTESNCSISLPTHYSSVRLFALAFEQAKRSRLGDTRTI